MKLKTCWAESWAYQKLDTCVRWIRNVVLREDSFRAVNIILMCESFWFNFNFTEVIFMFDTERALSMIVLNYDFREWRMNNGVESLHVKTSSNDVGSARTFRIEMNIENVGKCEHAISFLKLKVEEKMREKESWTCFPRSKRIVVGKEWNDDSSIKLSPTVISQFFQNIIKVSARKMWGSLYPFFRE